MVDLTCTHRVPAAEIKTIKGVCTVRRRETEGERGRKQIRTNYNRQL